MASKGPNMVICRRCGEWNDKTIADGKCGFCGSFIKGNKQGVKSRRGDKVKMLYKEALEGVYSPRELADRLKDIAECGDVRTALKALQYLADRAAGMMVKEVKADITTSEKKDVADAAKKFIDSLNSSEEDE